MTTMQIIKKIINFFFILSFIGMLIILGFTIITNYAISAFAKNYIYDSIENVKTYKVGLLLGTSKYVKSGNTNEYFSNRIDAAVNLYKNGKITKIIISGDNSERSYNEPRDMKRELIKRGIPDSCIYLDYAGFRTLDSVIRAKEIFGQQTFIIISQKFHNERAIFLARKNGIDAYGFNAKEVSKNKRLKTKIREWFARDKAVFDVIFNVKPKFLGEKIEIK